MALKTVKVDSDLHREIKIASTLDNKTMHEIVREAFELYQKQEGRTGNENN